MQTIKKIFHTTVLRSDLLSTSATLRYKGEAQYESFALGIISILTVGAFITIFAFSFVQVLQLQSITAFQQLSDNIDSATPIDDIMFAVGIDGVSMNDFSLYFQFMMIENTIATNLTTSKKNATQRNIKMGPCDLSYWQGQGVSSLTQFFDKRGMSSLFCPTQAFSIQGTSQQDYYKNIILLLKACDNTTVPSCKSDNLTNYMNNFVSKSNFFRIVFYIKDTIISPTSSSPISNYISTQILITFSPTTGSIGYIKLADYQVDTDTNIWPWTIYQSLSGYYIGSFQASSVPIVANSQRWMYILIDKSTKILSVERQYGKLDQMLSYVGGLFSLLFILIEYFTTSYNSYRYEISVGESLFNYDDKGNQVKQDDITFFAYFTYTIYNWLELFGCEPESWTQSKKIHQTRQQTNAQMDVRLLMKKIRYLENVAQLLMTDEQRICLYLSELPTLQQVKKNRNFSQFYDQCNNQNGLKKIIEFTFEDFKAILPIADKITLDKDIIQKQQISNDNIKLQQPMQLSQQYVQVANNFSSALQKLASNDSDPINRKISQKLSNQVIRRIQKNRKKQIQLQSQQQLKLKMSNVHKQQ